MDISNTLPVIAEISIAFAGFSGLIVALRKNPGPLTPVQKYRLQVLLALSFGTLFLSFFPELLRAFGKGEIFVWRFSSIAVMLYSVIFVAWWVVRSLRVARAAPEIFQWFVWSRMLAGHAVIVGLQLWVLLTGNEERVPAAFLAGLIWYLLHAAQQFCRMLFIHVASDA